MTGEVKGEDLRHRSMPLAVWQVAIKLCLDLGEGGEERPYNWIQLQIVSLIMHTPPYDLGV